MKKKISQKNGTSSSADDLYYERSQILTVAVTDAELMVFLKDGRSLTMPLWWSPRLLAATPEQRNNFELGGFGDGIHWPDIDEDINVRGILYGNKCPGAVKPELSRPVSIGRRPKTSPANNETRV